jgi:hypothetical protein
MTDQYIVPFDEQSRTNDKFNSGITGKIEGFAGSSYRISHILPID